MSIVLARIDDRFIHGQVAVGWHQRLRPARIVLANDEIAADTWRSRVYRQAVPPETEVAVLSLEDAARLLVGGSASVRSLLLTGSPADIGRLLDYGVPLAEINVGGMHYSAGKRELLPFVYVDRGDLEAFAALLDAGCTLRAQQVPGGKATLLDTALLAEVEGLL